MTVSIHPSVDGGPVPTGREFSGGTLKVRRQLTDLFGDYGFDAERDIAGIIANRWGHAYFIPQPGYYYGRDGKPAPREIIREGYGRIAFGHSELTGEQLWSNAVAEGERATRQLMKRR